MYDLIAFIRGKNMLSLYLSVIDTKEEKDKFTQIYLRYNGFVYAIANKFFKNKSDAEDAMHNIFLKAIRYLHCFDKIDSFETKGLIARIANSVCIDSYRKNSKFEILSVDDIEEVSTSYLTAEDIYMEDEKTAALYSKINGFKPIYKDIIIMKAVYGLSYQEIADISGVEIKTVHKRFERAKNMLKELL